jgi:1,4-alpha-glucan branching enzyme
MGNEFAQFIEWNYNQGLDWLLMLYPKHVAHCNFIKALNHLYLKNSALWENDDNWEGFSWVQSKQNDNLVAYTRTSKSKKLLIILNFSGLDYRDYRFGIERGSYELLLSSDDVAFGGEGKLIPQPQWEYVPCDGKKTSLRINIPRQSALILKMK